MSGVCSVDGCARPSSARGWCTMHYQRWRTHGDPGTIAPRGPIVDEPMTHGALGGVAGRALPEHPRRAGRWSAEQRAARAQRCRTERWLYENVVVPTRTLEEAMGGAHNAYQDLTAAGCNFRHWWSTADAAASFRHLDGDHYSPGGRSFRSLWPDGIPHVSEVTPPTPPTPDLRRIRSWLLVNGCESWKSMGEYGGHRWGGAGPEMAARRRGTHGWSAAELDRIYPDQTCGPATRSATVTDTTAIRIPTDLRDRLASAADERGVSVSWITSKLLDEALGDLLPAEHIRLTRRTA